MVGRLQGKVALVTGATSGIGRASALRFAREGAAVAVGGIDQVAGADVVQEIESHGGRAIYLNADVEHADQIARTVRETLAALGPVTVFFSNAAIGTNVVGGTVETIDEDRWHKTLEINLTAAYRFCKLVVPEMRRAGGGSIVFTSSYAAFRALRSRPSHAYASTKGALLALMHAVAVSYAGDRIRCNAICPYFIETSLNRDMLASPGAREAQSRAIPLGRLGQPEDVANLALFLASDESDYITVQAFIIDGGVDVVARTED